jgi:hypothetical protein
MYIFQQSVRSNLVLTFRHYHQFHSVAPSSSTLLRCNVSNGDAKRLFCSTPFPISYYRPNDPGIHVLCRYFPTAHSISLLPSEE